MLCTANPVAHLAEACKNERMSRIVLAMSGGVDSSVAAWLLRQAGHEVVGLFMRHGHQETTTCSTSPPLPRGSRVAAAQATRPMPGASPSDWKSPSMRSISKQEFGRIIHYFISEYTSGRTPNPCVVCNTWLKFGKLVDYADSVGARQIATGHYARLVQTPDGRLALCRGLDPGKDQSYVLWGIRPEVLARLQFPVGDYQKEEIRRIADRLGLHHVAEKPDSQEICFVPDQDHARFIRENRPPQDTSGEIVTTDGRVVGRHEGVEKFTIGQRKGLGVALGEPRYVVRIDAAEPRSGRRHQGRACPARAFRPRGELVLPARAAFRVPGEDSLPQRGGRGRRGDLAGRSIPRGIPGALLRGCPRAGRSLLSGRRGLGRGLDRLSWAGAGSIDRAARHPDYSP